MVKQKRERSVNFTQHETNFLISLIEARKHTIENKKSDATTWQEKQKAWREIEKVFNRASDGTVFRDHKHLKLKYEALKRDAKKKIAVGADPDKTGGGTSPVQALTHATEDEKGNEMIFLPVEVNVSVSESETDSDSIMQNNPMDKKPYDRLMEEKLEIAEIQRKVVAEELEHKLIQRKILETEYEHKMVMHELEKQHLRLKIELLKRELNKN
uniref:Regulatory protein zeste n=1 Tax=Heliothis virescens TaxID=7102 RepID=A0A2A4KAY8_HELVI